MVGRAGAPGTPLHTHAVADEGFYVLEGTFGFRVGEETVEAAAGAFVFAPKGVSTRTGTGDPRRPRCS